MSVWKPLRRSLAILEQPILKKRGLVVAPIASAMLAAKIYPTALLAFFPGLLALVLYRTVRVSGNKLGVFGSSFGVVIISCILLRTFFLEVRYIVGEGMSPPLANDTRVLVDKTAYWWPNSPRRGDIVITKLDVLRDMQTGVTYFGNSERVKVSRIIGLPGEAIAVQNGITYINGEPLSDFGLKPSYIPESYQTATLGSAPESCIRDDTQSSDATGHPFQTGKGGQNPLAKGVHGECFFLFRDDHAASSLPGDWAIPQKSIIGKVTAILWPRPDQQPKLDGIEIANDP